MKKKFIKVLKVAPGKEPEVVTLQNNLEALQEAVSIGASHTGLIEIIEVDKDVCILCNEEGKLIDLEPNRKFFSDILCGVFYVTGQDKCGNLSSLPQHLIEQYTEVFKTPEHITPEEVNQTLAFRFYPY